ncbi:hypothetical protein ANRL4_01819 [Anaerolineae bacterium]|nr:hypothetical protein ANRL4_01819 [Anaerolineae bacterium]
MHPSRLASAFLKQGFNAGLFAKVLLAKVFNGQPSLRRHRFGIRTQLLRQGLGKLDVIENANAPLVQILRHPLRVAHGPQTPREHEAIVTVQDTVQLVGIFLG